MVDAQDSEDGAGGPEVQGHEVALSLIVSLRVVRDSGDHVWGGAANVKLPHHEGPEGVTDPLGQAHIQLPCALAAVTKLNSAEQLQQKQRLLSLVHQWFITADAASCSL